MIRNAEIRIRLAGIFAMGLLLAACNGGGGTAVNEGDLIGKWTLTKQASKGYMKTTINGTETTRNIDTSRTYAGDTYYAEFKENKTYVANIPPPLLFGGLGRVGIAAAPDSGTWSVAGGTITCLSGSGAYQDTLKLSADISGKSATFSTKNQYSYSEGSIKYETDIDISYSGTKP